MRTLIRVLLALALLVSVVPRPVAAAAPFVTIGYLPVATTGEEILVRGTAPRGNIVDLYDNGQLVVRVYTLADMDVYRITLPVSPGEHRLVAQVEGTSATAKTYFVRTTATFTDTTGHWAREDIEVMATLGVINGMGDGSFGPELNLTRAQFAKLLVLGLQQEPFDKLPPFIDANQIPDWAKGYVGAAVKLGLIKGFPDNAFRPNDQVTRAEVAVMAARALRVKQLTAAPGWAPSTGGVLDFADQDAIPDWAAADVAYVVGAKVIEKYWGGDFAAGQPATRALAAAVVRRIWTAGER